MLTLRCPQTHQWPNTTDYIISIHCFFFGGKRNKPFTLRHTDFFHPSLHPTGLVWDTSGPPSCAAGWLAAADSTSATPFFPGACHGEHVRIEQSQSLPPTSIMDDAQDKCYHITTNQKKPKTIKRQILQNWHTIASFDHNKQCHHPQKKRAKKNMSRPQKLHGSSKPATRLKSINDGEHSWLETGAFCRHIFYWKIIFLHGHKVCWKKRFLRLFFNSVRQWSSGVSCPARRASQEQKWLNW